MRRIILLTIVIGAMLATSTLWATGDLNAASKEQIIIVANGTNWVAIVGILGALGGVIVGALSTWFIQERQLKHSDATRFQEFRLETYAKYTGTANLLVSHRRNNQRDSDLAEEYFYLQHIVRLVATDKVAKIARLFHKKFLEIYLLGCEAEIPTETSLEFNRLNADFVIAARNELRISKLPLPETSGRPGGAV